MYTERFNLRIFSSKIPFFGNLLEILLRCTQDLIYIEVVVFLAMNRRVFGREIEIYSALSAFVVKTHPIPLFAQFFKCSSESYLPLEERESLAEGKL